LSKTTTLHFAVLQSLRVVFGWISSSGRHRDQTTRNSCLDFRRDCELERKRRNPITLGHQMMARIHISHLLSRTKFCFASWEIRNGKQSEGMVLHFRFLSTICAAVANLDRKLNEEGRTLAGTVGLGAERVLLSSQWKSNPRSPISQAKF